jgi:hypothetical protein
VMKRVCKGGWWAIPYQLSLRPLWYWIY